MRRKISLSLLLLAGCCLTASLAQGQKVYEPLPAHQFSLGAGFGMTDTWGDIGTKSNSDHYFNNYYWHHPQFMGSLYLRYSILPAISVRLGAGFGSLYASDQYNKSKANENIGKQFDVYQRYTRNLDFRSGLAEGSLLVEIHPFRFFPHAAAGHWKLQPVLMGGLAYFHFNPEATYLNPENEETEWVKTHDLHLEGEGLPYDGAPAGYKLSQWAIPMGGGLHWQVSETVAVGFEYLYRKTFTDYLDGVSNTYINPAIFDQYLSPEDARVAKQIYNKTTTIDPDVARVPGDLRGSPKHKDAYSSVSFTVFLTLKPYRTWWRM